MNFMYRLKNWIVKWVIKDDGTIGLQFFGVITFVMKPVGEN